MTPRHYSKRVQARRQASFERYIVEKRQGNPIHARMALPPDINLNEVFFAPTWQERELERLVKMKQQWDRDWLIDATRRLAAVALIGEEDKREIARITEQEKIDAWFAGEAADNAKLLERYQELLDNAKVVTK